MRKINREKAILAAEGFWKAGELLRAEMQNDGWKMGNNASAMMVNYTFACEVYLKIILYENKVDYGNTHCLNDLYKLLSEDCKTIIEKEYVSEQLIFKENNPFFSDYMEIAECVQYYSEGFEMWRYIYEDKGKKSKRFFLAGPDLVNFVYVLRKYVKKEGE